MTVQCCKCKKVRLDQDWIVPFAPPQGAISHTYCPPCADIARIEFFSAMASGVSAFGAAHLARVLTKHKAAT